VTSTQCVLIADDLTGACDAAAPFAASGLSAVVPLAGKTPVADVVSFSTDSRDVKPDEARRRLCAIAPQVRQLAPRVVFKKIDSTLRGNTGHEIVAAVDAFACDAAVANPAFPATGRIVVAGHLLAGDGSFRPIQMLTFLENHGAGKCRHTPPGAIAFAIDDGIRFVSMEAGRDADLDEIAAELLAIERPILWAGSAGLASALAKRIAGPRHPRPKAAASGPVLFCIGSDHRLTVAQQRRLLTARDVAVEPGALTEGRHVLLRLAWGKIEPDELRAVFTPHRPAAIVLSGGDTASLVCRALGVEAIQIRGELWPGIPVGTLCGGAYDGVAVVTKSGGFGNPDTLVEIADYFHG
jgi:D-threonate/D-erythronate kinase